MSTPVSLDGTTLITGPSNTGKTRMTYRTLVAWTEREGADGVVVLDFAPELERDGRILGGRLDRFGSLPEGAWVGTIDAHAPRAEGETEAASIELARENAERAAQVLTTAPDNPRAVFVNDATIPFQHERGDIELLTGYCDEGDCAVLNAFESDELGTNDPVSRCEQAALSRLHAWADHTIEATEI
jgi:hypothetical protein